MIANCAATDVKPGSMDRPLPGIEAAIAYRGEAGIGPIEAPGVEGELVLDDAGLSP